MTSLDILAEGFKDPTSRTRGDTVKASKSGVTKTFLV